MQFRKSRSRQKISLIVLACSLSRIYPLTVILINSNYAQITACSAVCQADSKPDLY
jgi:hypothetical protein